MRSEEFESIGLTESIVWFAGADLGAPHRAQARSVTSDLAVTVGREQHIEHVVAPDVVRAQIVAQQAFAAEPEFLDQPARRGVVGVDEGLDPVQTEFALENPDNTG